MTLSRRSFLGVAAAGTVAVATAGCSTQADPENEENSGGNNPSDTAWESLRSKLEGTLVRPGDPTFPAMGLPRNTAFADIRPVGAAVCASSTDVQECVRWAVENDVPIVPRSPGAHSYAGYGATTGLSIDLSRLQNVAFDSDAETVKLGGGTLLGPASLTLADSGVYIPVGQCQTVGIAGLALAGGLSFNSRLRGLTCDNLVEIEGVDAKGELFRSSSAENPELFWAQRGGGGGTFAINTSFTIRTYPATKLSVFRLVWTGDPAKLGAGWSAMQKTLVGAPNEYSFLSTFAVTSPDRQSRNYRYRAQGQFHGSSAQLREILTPALEASPDSVYIQDTTFLDGSRFLSELGAPNAYLSKSAFLSEYYPDAAVSVFVERLKEWPVNMSLGAIRMFSWAGAINEVPAGETAFVHRDAKLLSEGEVGWYPGTPAPEVDQGKAWLQQMWKDLEQYQNGSAFQNFMDPTLENWEDAYFGDNLSRLRSVKQQWDPDNVFSNRQSIRP